MTPHVAVLITSAGQRALANLARDAIAKFTEDVSHEVWLLDTKLDLEHGSQMNGEALQRMIQGAGRRYSDRISHFFVMHDDALPIASGWLWYLLAQPGPVVGVKASERNGYAHASGVLFEYSFAVLHSMLPDLPRRDAGEWPGWCAPAYCNRVRLGDYGARYWWGDFNCDVSFTTASPDGGDLSDPFYVHFGGGTLNRRPDTAAWIAAARKALELSTI